MSTGQDAVTVFCGLEGNRTSGIVPAIMHLLRRRQVFFIYLVEDIYQAYVFSTRLELEGVNPTEERSERICENLTRYSGRGWRRCVRQM